jgi:hypothetical protein
VSLIESCFSSTAKNVILAGVKSVSLFDNNSTQYSDLAAQASARMCSNVFEVLVEVLGDLISVEIVVMLIVLLD